MVCLKQTKQGEHSLACFGLLSYGGLSWFFCLFFLLILFRQKVADNILGFPQNLYLLLKFCYLFGTRIRNILKGSDRDAVLTVCLTLPAELAKSGMTYTRLWPLGCQREAIDEKLKSFSRKFHQLCFGRRVHHITGAPAMRPYQGQTVGEGRRAVAIPGRDRHRDMTTLAQPQRQHGGDGEQDQQDQGCTGDGLVRPLALRLHPERRPGLRKGHFD
jgi:hypothetical protein